LVTFYSKNTFERTALILAGYHKTEHLRSDRCSQWVFRAEFSMPNRAIGSSTGNDDRRCGRVHMRKTLRPGVSKMARWAPPSRDEDHETNTWTPRFDLGQGWPSGQL